METTLHRRRSDAGGILHCLGFAMLAVVVVAPCTAQSGWVPAASTGPSARGFLPLAYDLNRGVTVLFGGWDGSPKNDTWEWNGTQWTQQTPLHSPSPRCCHAMTYDAARGRVVMFGGTDASVDFADTWEWNGVDWTQAAPVHSPSPRRQMRATFDWATGRVVAFGGGLTGLGTPTYNDTWDWDGVDWKLRATPNAPSARWSHGLAFDAFNGGLVLFGGSPTSLTPLGDTWLLHGSVWEQLDPAVAPPRTTRLQLGGNAFTGVVVLFGGEGSTMINDTWVWNGHIWTPDPRVGPSARSECGVAFDLRRNKLVVFGGYSNLGYPGDTWEYTPGDLATWQPFGAGCTGSAGVPALGFAAGTRPILGTTAQIELRGVATNALASIALGLSDQFAGGIPLPIDLSPIGMTGCSLWSSLEAVVPVPVVAGAATLSLSIPNRPALAGARFFSSGFVAEAGANPLGVIVSNACSALLGSH